jgi:hypothetical protein
MKSVPFVDFLLFSPSPNHSKRAEFVEVDNNTELSDVLIGLIGSILHVICALIAMITFVVVKRCIKAVTEASETEMMNHLMSASRNSNTFQADFANLDQMVGNGETMAMMSWSLFVKTAVNSIPWFPPE